MNSLPKSNATIAFHAIRCLPILLALSLAAGFATQPALGAPSAEASKNNQLSVPYDEIRAFADIFARVKKEYVQPVDDKTLMEHAIRGLLSGLDPHSAYLSKRRYKDVHEDTTGEFGGLGIEVGIEDGFVKVIAPIDDTPAERAGVLAGDIITRLDGESVKGIGLGAAVSRMRGKPGEPIVLTIVREDSDMPLEITVVRDIIKVKSVKSRALQPGYLYLRITRFQTHTAKLLQEAIADFKQAHPGGIKGAVLDLRNNPGGVLHGAVNVADVFLQEGLIVYTKGRGTASASRYQARPGDLLDGAPLVVLVNGGSASASEIVAGALQDHGRGVLLGEKTFGKGSVQTVLPMGNGEAIKLTTALYYTPSGRSIQALGITPDIPTRNLRLQRGVAENDGRVSEAQLSGHLQNADDTPSAVAAKPKAQSLAETDYPLYEALNLLKSLSIVQNRRQTPSQR